MQYFYHEIFKKYVIAFAHVFSDVYVRRLDDAGDQVGSDIKVPIIYAAKRKLYNKDQEGDDPELVKVSTILPRMGFVFSGMQYDGMRKTNSHYEINVGDYSMKHSGVPYNITCDLAILAKNQSDLLQIIEQIVVNFKPDLTLTIHEIEGYVERDVPITLDAINFGSVLEYGDIEQRIITADLSFTIKGTFYPKLDTHTATIYNIITNYKPIVGVTPTTGEYISQITCDFDPITELVTSTNHGLESGTTLYVMNSSVSPVGIEELTPYYVINPTVDSFALSTTVDGATINIQSEGEVWTYYSVDNYPTHDSIRYSWDATTSTLVKSFVQNY